MRKVIAGRFVIEDLEWDLIGRGGMGDVCRGWIGRRGRWRGGGSARPGGGGGGDGVGRVGLVGGVGWSVLEWGCFKPIVSCKEGELQTCRTIRSDLWKGTGRLFSSCGGG